MASDLNAKASGVNINVNQKAGQLFYSVWAGKGRDMRQHCLNCLTTTPEILTKRSQEFIKSWKGGKA